MSDAPDSKTTEFGTGAVRSSDANHLSFTSLPLVGLLAVARTAGEGAEKYGRYNYMLGMPAHDMLDHAMRHIVMFLLGDRSEPHLPHAAWGLLAVIQSLALDPEISAPHLLGPGATVGPEMRSMMSVNALILKVRREAGEFADSGSWNLNDLREIATILEQRHVAKIMEVVGIPYAADAEHRERCRKLDEAVSDYYRQRVAEETAKASKKIMLRLDAERETPRALRLFAVTHEGATRAVPGEIWLRDKVDPDQESPWEKVYIVHRPEDHYGLMSAELNGVRTMVVTRTVWDKAPRSIILHPGFDVSTGTINGVPVIGFNRATTMTSPAEEITEELVKHDFNEVKEALAKRKPRPFHSSVIQTDYHDDDMPF